jgi:lactobin A/cerein 7B family class IIb bacteriocin
MEKNIVELSDFEIEEVGGGLGPVGAYAIATALGALFVASFSAGYEFGKDLAS